MVSARIAGLLAALTLSALPAAAEDPAPALPGGIGEAAPGAETAMPAIDTDRLIEAVSGSTEAGGAEPAETAGPVPAVPGEFVLEIDPEVDLGRLAAAWAILDPRIDGRMRDYGFVVLTIGRSFPADEVLALLNATRGVLSAAPNTLDTYREAPPGEDPEAPVE